MPSIAGHPQWMTHLRDSNIQHLGSERQKAHNYREGARGVAASGLGGKGGDKQEEHRVLQGGDALPCGAVMVAL